MKVLWLLFAAVVLLFAVTSIIDAGPRNRALTTGQFFRELRDGTVREVEWQQDRISGTMNDETHFTIRAVPPDSPAGAQVMQVLTESGAKWDIVAPSWSSRILSVLPIIVISLIFFVFLNSFLARFAPPRPPMSGPS
jgi:ATP-dependent Zn protease